MLLLQYKRICSINANKYVINVSIDIYPQIRWLIPCKMPIAKSSFDTVGTVSTLSFQADQDSVQ
jgi:hypothetical protein